MIFLCSFFVYVFVFVEGVWIGLWYVVGFGEGRSYSKLVRVGVVVGCWKVCDIRLIVCLEGGWKRICGVELI